MERVEAALNGSAQNLPEIGENRYQGKLNAPATKAKEVVYPLVRFGIQFGHIDVRVR